MFRVAKDQGRSAIACHLYNWQNWKEATSYFKSVQAGTVTFLMGNVIYAWHPFGD
jgi:hypothetical protein